MVQLAFPVFDDMVSEYQALSKRAATSSPKPFFTRLGHFIRGDLNVVETFGWQTPDARTYYAFMRRHPRLAGHRRLLVAHTAADLCPQLKKLEDALVISPEHIGIRNALRLGQKCYDERRNSYNGL
jgi:hypothetical protein